MEIGTFVIDFFTAREWASITLIALFAVIGEFSGAVVSGSQSEYGAFVLSAETGGYALTAILGIILGVCTTLVVKRLKNK